MDPGQLVVGDLQRARDARADREHDRVVALLELLGGDVGADVGVIDELDPLLLEDRHPAVDDRLLELGVGHPEAQQAAGALVALVDGDRVAALVQLGGDRQPRGARADHRDRAARAPVGHLGDDPALGERPLDDRQLDLLDRHRVVVDLQHACRLARRGADQAGELGEVVRRVQLVDRVVPLVAVDEVVPVGDEVAQRTALVAERHPAVHAARALAAQLGLGLQREVLVVVADAAAGVALVEADPMDLEERTELAHGMAKRSRERPPDRAYAGAGAASAARCASTRR